MVEPLECCSLGQMDYSLPFQTRSFPIGFSGVVTVHQRRKARRHQPRQLSVLQQLALSRRLGVHSNLFAVRRVSW